MKKINCDVYIATVLNPYIEALYERKLNYLGSFAHLYNDEKKLKIIKTNHNGTTIY
jgi:hypothetical protein